MTPKLSPIAAALCLLCTGTAAAVPLQQILRNALQNDPTVLEARANEQAAQSSVKEARAGHYPVVSVTGTQMIAQHHRHDYDRNTDKFNPGLNANLNLYAWGGIESEVRQNQHKAEYYYHKIAETQEELGSTVGKLYLGALRAKELIAAAQNNISRHERIVSDLQIIAKHDKGRQSELDQALDRKLRAEGYLIEQTHQLESNLSRLGKYTGSMMSPDDLEDPFVQDTQTSLIERYRNEDLAQLPGYLAQQAEKESVVEEVNVAKAARYPRINLVGTADRDNREIYVNFDWAFYNPAAKYNVERTAHTLTVAETKMDQILRDVAERSRNAQIDMAQYMRRYQLAQQQIASQQRVIKAYELQFKIARRTLIDVLDSYADLSNIEINAITAQNNYRDAALEYLVSQAAIGKWSGVGSVFSTMDNTQTVADKPAVLAQEQVNTSGTTSQTSKPSTQPKSVNTTVTTETQTVTTPTETAAENTFRQPENTGGVAQQTQTVETKVETQTVKTEVTTPAAASETAPVSQPETVNTTVKTETQTVTTPTETAAENTFRQPENTGEVTQQQTQTVETKVETQTIETQVATPAAASETAPVSQPETVNTTVTTETQTVTPPTEAASENTFRQPESDVSVDAPEQSPASKNIIAEAVGNTPKFEPQAAVVAPNTNHSPAAPLESTYAVPLTAVAEQAVPSIDSNENIIATSVFNPTEIQLP